MIALSPHQLVDFAWVSKLLSSWGPVMTAYRVYCLDGAGKVWAARWIDAADDSAALDAARRLHEAVECEVWQGQRLVGRVQPTERRS
jgi:hypothetical protein